MWPGVAAAQSEPSETPAPQNGPAEQAPPQGAPPELVRPLIDGSSALPPPSNIIYLQYGVAVTAELPTARGPICDTNPCILGPGGGVAIRVGGRDAGPLYFGLAYEASKQDPNKLYRLALMQQVRAEGRYYWVTGRETEPYLLAGLGLGGYGDEWRIDTWGPSGTVGIGFERQITRRTVAGVAMGYRLMWWHSFTDTSGAFRAPGLSQVFGLDFVLEQRDPIASRPR